jgi:hypothetical protein
VAFSEPATNPVASLGAAHVGVAVGAVLVTAIAETANASWLSTGSLVRVGL